MLNEKSFFRLTSINKIYLQMSLESCTFVVGKAFSSDSSSLLSMSTKKPPAFFG